jgi:hypothetical protein
MILAFFVAAGPARERGEPERRGKQIGTDEELVEKEAVGAAY